MASHRFWSPKQGRPILLVSHEATRTGAPRIAVEVLRGLAPLGVRRIAVLRWGGPLAEDFRRAADVVAWEPLRRVRVSLRRHRHTKRLATFVEQVAAGAVLLRHRPAMVYLNTVLAASYVRPARLLGHPVVLHVHELEPLASQALARYRLGRLDGVRLIACSEAVRANLTALSGVPAGTIEVVPSSVDPARIRQLGGPPPGRRGTVLVGACGTADQRKGVDQWLEMAGAARARARRQGVDIRFEWVGRATEGVAAGARRLGLEAAVRFTGEQANPFRNLAALDVFTHPAREDPFPLAVLEAMALGKPVVAFDVGGVRSQLGDAGILVPPGDVEAMAVAVVELATDPARREQLGRQASARVSDRFTVDRLHRDVRRIVEAAMAGPAVRPPPPAP